ncbi:hypothetical protein SAMN05421740_105115 [Parapedobacter koreensis]|uniref:Uncharacterized protein n=1 Tax=Parapedobacter koreensis TaxID=332977 RepID=A0A1H7Q0S3_9SPHI|nr:hypothetical protein SAMN05421740_105115 [Parapedobacter koreensis]
MFPYVSNPQRPSFRRIDYTQKHAGLFPICARMLMFSGFSAYIRTPMLVGAQHRKVSQNRRNDNNLIYVIYGKI